MLQSLIKRSSGIQNGHHLEAVESISKALQRLGIIIIWVEENGKVILSQDYFLEIS